MGKHTNIRFRILSLSFFAALTLPVLGCDDDGGGDGGGGGAEARAACYDQCQAQEDGGCGVGLQDCKDLCDVLVDALDDDCRAKAQASYECNVANDEVCDVNMVCETEATEYANCLAG